MGKKKTQKHLQQKHVLARVNYMYQASMLMAGQHNTLSSYYGALCKRISRRATQRIAPDIKRNMCRRCSLALQPGVTAELSFKGERSCIQTEGYVSDNTNNFSTNSSAPGKRKRKRRRRRRKHNAQPPAELPAKSESTSTETAEKYQNGDIVNIGDPEKIQPALYTSTSNRIMDEHSQLQVSCVLCGMQRRFRVNTQYNSWLEQPEAVPSVTVLREKHNKPTMPVTSKKTESTNN